MTIGAFLSNGLFSFVIPFLFTISFIVFVWGIFLYVIPGGHDEELREKGKVLLLYALVSFLIIIGFSGLVHSLR